ncbi:peptidoglycan-binding protein, partial [Streptomyces phyllanthi]
PTPEPPTAPWISECTHYSGNGLTRRGNSGKRVLQVQCILTKRGYGVGSSGVDGEFGPGTESAVRSFQADKGLAVDGIVGRETWVALRGTT